MSNLAQDEEFVESGQEFAEELDDEASTTSAVLETFEISSNSMSTCSDVGTTVATVDDSSSSDTVKLVDVSDNGGLMPFPISRPAKGFFNPNKVYVINDEDDEEEAGNENEVEQAQNSELNSSAAKITPKTTITTTGINAHLADDDEDILNDNENHNEAETAIIEKSTTNRKLEMETDIHVNDEDIEVNDVEDVSQIPLPSGSSSNIMNGSGLNEMKEAQVEAQTTNDLIMQQNAAPIFLETPVIEDQQQHHHHQHLHHESHHGLHHYPHNHHLRYHHQHMQHSEASMHMPQQKLPIYKPHTAAHAHMHCNLPPHLNNEFGIIGADHHHLHQHHHHLQCSLAECLNDDAALDVSAMNSHCQQQPPPPPPPISVYPLNFGEAFEHIATDCSNDHANLHNMAPNNETMACRLRQMHINNNCIHNHHHQQQQQQQQQQQHQQHQLQHQQQLQQQHHQQQQQQHQQHIENLNTNAVASTSSCATVSHNAQPAEVPSNEYAGIDIESMDLLERRDFETEQRLTGGIILKNTNKNTLNLEIIKNCISVQNQQQQHNQQENKKAEKPTTVQKCLSPLTDNQVCIKKN